MVKRGFTLVELLAVILIIGIISAIAIPIFSRIVGQNADELLKTNARELFNAGYKYFMENDEKLPKRDGETSSVTYGTLKQENYIGKLVNPYNTSEECSLTSYVQAINKDDIFTFSVVLQCGAYVYVVDEMNEDGNIVSAFEWQLNKPSDWIEFIPSFINVHLPSIFVEKTYQVRSRTLGFWSNLVISETGEPKPLEPYERYIKHLAYRFYELSIASPKFECVIDLYNEQGNYVGACFDPNGERIIHNRIIYEDTVPKKLVKIQSFETSFRVFPTIPTTFSETVGIAVYQRENEPPVTIPTDYCNPGNNGVPADTTEILYPFEIDEPGSTRVVYQYHFESEEQIKYWSSWTTTPPGEYSETLVPDDDGVMIRFGCQYRNSVLPEHYSEWYEYISFDDKEGPVNDIDGDGLLNDVDNNNLVADETSLLEKIKAVFRDKIGRKMSNDEILTIKTRKIYDYRIVSSHYGDWIFLEEGELPPEEGPLGSEILVATFYQYRTWQKWSEWDYCIKDPSRNFGIINYFQNFSDEGIFCDVVEYEKVGEDKVNRQNQRRIVYRWMFKP